MRVCVLCLSVRVCMCPVCVCACACAHEYLVRVVLACRDSTTNLIHLYREVGQVIGAATIVSPQVACGYTAHVHVQASMVNQVACEAKHGEHKSLSKSTRTLSLAVLRIVASVRRVTWARHCGDCRRHQALTQGYHARLAGLEGLGDGHVSHEKCGQEGCDAREQCTRLQPHTRTQATAKTSQTVPRCFLRGLAVLI